MNSVIHAARVRYIKLGEKGGWEDECFQKGIIRFGFGSATVERFPLCHSGKWAELTASFLAEGKDKGTATRFKNETKLFFEDEGSILWITFIHDKFCWGFLTPTPAKRHEDGDGVYRELNRGWQSTDIKGVSLTKDRLSGALTKLTGYRGTSCNVDEDVSSYVVRRINGEQIPEVERGIAALKEMNASIVGMMKKLIPQDFELLVDLVFTASGWRRLGAVGGTQKTIDLDLILPTTGERAFVQVKSNTTQTEFDEYAKEFQFLGSYQKMFYVYHSGEVETDDERFFLVGNERFAEMVIDAGLVSWLIRKVS